MAAFSSVSVWPGTESRKNALAQDSSPVYTEEKQSPQSKQLCIHFELECCMAGERKRRRRPFGVYVIITLQLFSIVAGLFVFAAEYLAFNYPELNIDLELGFPLSGPEFWIANLQLAIVLVLSVISVIGLWRMQRWAWYLTMLELGFSMVINISMYFNGNANYVDMFLNVLTVFYLNQKDVQRAFVRRRVEAA